MYAFKDAPDVAELIGVIGDCGDSQLYNQVKFLDLMNKMGLTYQRLKAARNDDGKPPSMSEQTISRFNEARALIKVLGDMIGSAEVDAVFATNN